MKAKTIKIYGEVLVILEDNNKNVEVIGKNSMKPFTSFESALRWAKKEEFNGVWNMGYY
jgi:hypothetical protein